MEVGALDQLSYHYSYRSEKQRSEHERCAKADNLYYRFRYRRDSYKGRKAGLRPVACHFRCGGDHFRLYGDASGLVSDKMLRIARGLFAAWKAKTRAIKAAHLVEYRSYLKEHKLKPPDLSFWQWLKECK